MGADGYRGLIGGAIENLERERAGGEIAYLPGRLDGGPALMPGQEPFDYYGTERSTSAVWENRMTVDSRYQLLTLDTLSAAELLDLTPFLVVHGTVDTYCTPEGAQAIFDRATGPKEIEWIETPNHIDIYDRPELVDAAVSRVTAFLATQLAPREAVGA